VSKWQKTPPRRRDSVRVRSFTSTSASSLTSTGSAKSPFAVFGVLTDELDRLSPRIELKPGQIEILKTPKEFYDTLKVCAS
jgi:hypothetical protein